MTTYRAIAVGEYAETEGVKLALATAWSSNPEAIAEGSAGAPKVQLLALDIDSVNLAIARDSSEGDVGTYAVLKAATWPHDFGDTLAGSSLSPAGIAAYGASYLARPTIVFPSTVLSGTWQCMGFAPAVSDNDPLTLWLRVL